MNIKNKKGVMILVITYMIIAILLILGIAFFYRSFDESKLAERQKDSVRALSIAEGGLNRAIYELRQDFINNPTNPSWSDGNINGITCGPDTTNFYTLYSTTSLGNGSYIVELKNVDGKTNEIWVRSTSTVGDINKIVSTYLKLENLNVWDNAIFAGTGASGQVINGNVNINGSVHILGTGLQDTDLAINMSGGAAISNNYSGIPSDLSSRIPACPTTSFGGETVQSLGTNVRIKNGRVALAGSSSIGTTNQTGNQYKETVDAVFNTDGYNSSSSESKVKSDNGTQHSYDLGDSVPFPKLSDPYPGYSSYQAYLEANALVISDSSALNKLANIKPNSSFSYSNAKGSISMDGNGNMVVSGIVYIDGGELNMNKQGPNKTITYSGRGSILATGEVEINVNLLTNGAGSFPNNIVGIMTPQEIEFDEANINVMGVFYAQDKIKADKQTNVAGSLVSNYFDLGSQVPSVYQVPNTINNLPPGLVGSDPVWVLKVISWQEL